MRWASLPIVLLLFLSCRFSAVVLRVHAPDFFSTFLTWDHSGSQTGLDGYPKVVNALAFAQNLPLSKKHSQLTHTTLLTATVGRLVWPDTPKWLAHSPLVWTFFFAFSHHFTDSVTAAVAGLVWPDTPKWLMHCTLSPCLNFPFYFLTPLYWM